MWCELRFRFHATHAIQLLNAYAYYAWALPLYASRLVLFGARKANGKYAEVHAIYYHHRELSRCHAAVVLSCRAHWHWKEKGILLQRFRRTAWRRFHVYAYWSDWIAKKTMELEAVCVCVWNCDETDFKAGIARLENDEHKAQQLSRCNINYGCFSRVVRTAIGMELIRGSAVAFWVCVSMRVLSARLIRSALNSSQFVCRFWGYLLEWNWYIAGFIHLTLSFCKCRAKIIGLVFMLRV